MWIVFFFVGLAYGFNTFYTAATVYLEARGGGLPRTITRPTLNGVNQSALLNERSP